MKTGLTVTTAFTKTALAFPDKARQAVAAIEKPRDAAKALRGGDAMLRLANDLGATTEEVRAIQWGRLIIIAKLGELMPIGKRGPQTKDNHTDCEKLGLHPNTITAYRKVAKWREKIDDYCPTADDPSMADFLRWTGASNAAYDGQQDIGNTHLGKIDKTLGKV